MAKYAPAHVDTLVFGRNPTTLTGTVPTGYHGFLENDVFHSAFYGSIVILNEMKVYNGGVTADRVQMGIYDLHNAQVAICAPITVPAGTWGVAALLARPVLSVSMGVTTYDCSTSIAGPVTLDATASRFYPGFEFDGDTFPYLLTAGGGYAYLNFTNTSFPTGIDCHQSSVLGTAGYSLPCFADYLPATPTPTFTPTPTLGPNYPFQSYLYPTGGPCNTSNTVTITGTNLGFATAVHFGSELASITFRNSTSLIVNTQADQCGSVLVLSTNSYGNSNPLTYVFGGNTPTSTATPIPTWTSTATFANTATNTTTNTVTATCTNTIDPTPVPSSVEVDLTNIPTIGLSMSPTPLVANLVADYILNWPITSTFTNTPTTTSTTTITPTPTITLTPTVFVVNINNLTPQYTAVPQLPLLTAIPYPTLSLSMSPTPLVSNLNAVYMLNWPITSTFTNTPTITNTGTATATPTVTLTPTIFVVSISNMAPQFTPNPQLTQAPVTMGSGVTIYGGGPITMVIPTPVYKAITIQKFTSGTGTYTLPASPAPIYIRVVMAGGGGGGSGSGLVNTAGSGGNGGNTTFGSSLLAANGGIGGADAGATPASQGGTASLGTGPVGLALTGGNGQGTFGGYAGFVNLFTGGSGGNGPLGGAGQNGGGVINGSAGATNTGSGGSGAGGPNNAGNYYPGTGGGAGGYVDAIITSLASSYAYAVGAAGTAGTAGTSGNTGGAGGSGVIIVEEFYQ